MSTSMNAEWTPENSTELDHDLPEGSVEEDDKLKEHWAKKDRRRSSIYKDFGGDSLGLRDNHRVCMYLAKFGKTCDMSCHQRRLDHGVELHVHFCADRPS